MKTGFKRSLLLPLSGLLVLGLFIITFSEISVSQNAADAYQIDSVHSSVLFRAKHLGVAYFYGRFNDFSGNISIDEEVMSKNKVEFEVKTASVDTANEKRDQHLRSQDFFSAKQFPVITFKSTKVNAKAGQENMFEVTGDFELHGVKKSITVDVEITGKTKLPQVGEVMGFHSVFDIKRSEYGIDFGMDGVKDDIQIIVSIEAGKK